MERKLSILSSAGLMAVLNLFLVLRFAGLDHALLTGTVIFLVFAALSVYFVVTFTAFRELKLAPLSSLEKEFWKGVLIRCFYQLAGTPTYYEKKEKWKRAQAGGKLRPLPSTQIGDKLFYFLGIQVLGFILFLTASAICAGFSLIFTSLIDLPSWLIRLGVYWILPFPILSHFFFLRMLAEFVEDNLDTEELDYYFGPRRWLFGALKYYLDSRVEAQDQEMSLYKKLMNVTIPVS